MLTRLSATLAAICLAGTAQAGLEICNETDQQQSVAIGYKGASDWTSEGWWNVAPGTCALVVSGDLKQRYYYYRAETEGREFQGQRYVFCTRADAFTIVGDTDCAERGYERHEFREIDTGASATKFTLALIDTGAARPPGPDGGKTGGGTTITGTPPAAPPGNPRPSPPRIASDDTQNTTGAPPDVLPVTVSPEDLTSGMAPGRHGTAFTTDALFQGCEIEDDREYCGFHAGEWKIRAYYGGPTPGDLLYALEAMALNAPVEVEGDVVEATGNHMAIVLREVRPKPGADRDAPLRAALQGDWIDARDSRSEITVRGSEIYVRRDGDFTAAHFLRIAKSCQTSGGKGPVMLQTEAGGGRTSCYVIDAADGRRLDLTDPRRGTTLSYRRP